MTIRPMNGFIDFRIEVGLKSRFSDVFQVSNAYSGNACSNPWDDLGFWYCGVRSSFYSFSIYFCCM
jgi:hypothetical protein